METADWKPGARSGAVWSVIGLLLVVIGLFVYGIPVFARSGQTAIQVGLGDIAVVVVLLVGLVLVHEGIHAGVMSVFGARPSFGTVMVGGVMPAAYTTAPGHLFSRAQYLAVALAPAVLISVVGFAACFTAIGPYLVIPLAMHLGGCIGDAVACGRVLREPPGTMFEDLKDGIRFHRARQTTR